MVQRWLTWLIALAVVVPLAAYVAGSLAASDLPPPRRDPIIVEVDTTAPAKPTPSRSSPTPTDAASAPSGSSPRPPETVHPSPDDLDDPGDDLGRDDGDDDDDSDDDSDDDGGDDDGADD